MNTNNSRSRELRTAFTLIELLVSISIIAILIALLLPAVQQAREAARRSQCKNNLKQIGLALHNYHSTHSMFPPGAISPFTNWPPGGPHEGKNLFGWNAFLLPFLEQGPLYENIDFTKMCTDGDISITGVASVGNSKVCATHISNLRCPSDTGPDHHTNTVAGSGSCLNIINSTLTDQATTNYLANAGTQISYSADIFNGLFFWNSSIRFRDIIDGTSNTVAIGEHAMNQGPSQALAQGWWAASACRNTTGMFSYTAKTNINGDSAGDGTGSYNDNFSSKHKGGAQFLFCDGSVRFLSENIESNPIWANGGSVATGADMGIYQRIMVRNDGLVIGEF